jgi:phenylacetate-coenzyme A ligase PaaK-like adenylate-forming protein
MLSQEYYRKQIFSPKSPKQFDELALDIFRWQAENNSVYRSFIKGLKIDPASIKKVSAIPFLPISLFKTHEIITGNDDAVEVFTSSGTTGSVQSRHYVTDISLYEESYRRAFMLFYGDPKEYVMLALLPSYLEREGSSLIYMMDDLVKKAAPGSGFFLHNKHELSYNLKKLRAENKKIFLMGVTYALLDLAEEHPLELGDAIVMETGGMKGKRKEMIREELHDVLCNGLGVDKIHSEYGMTELLSQAYSKGDGIFYCPPWMRVLARDTDDPLSVIGPGRTGGLNVIDLANLNSCCFIATQDLGKIYEDGSFEVLGRFDNSDVRGCNLMVI